MRTVDDELSKCYEQLTRYYSLLKTVHGDWLDCREFYELMQAYRHSPIENQKETSEAFEAVKDYLLNKLLK